MNVNGINDENHQGYVHKVNLCEKCLRLENFGENLCVKCVRITEIMQLNLK